MNRLTFFICLFSLLLLIPAGVSALGNITVSSSPVGAFIYVDDVLKGITIATPFTIQNIEVGNRNIVLQLSGYQNYTTSRSIDDGGTQTIIASLTSTSNPAPTVSGISPNQGYNTSSSTLSGVTISGTGFSTSTGGVVLTKSGETNITGTCSWGSTSTITCSFPLYERTAGTWDVVVVNADGQSTTQTIEFTIKSDADTPTLTAIDPSSGQKNTTVTINSLTGTNFASTATIKLVSGYYDDVIGTVSSVNSAGTVIKGSFDLTQKSPGTYQVCVFNNANIYTCGLTFTVLSAGQTAPNSSIYFDTNPTGATVWLNATQVGTSVFTYYNVTPGTYHVLIKKSGYTDYSDTIMVLEGKRTTFYAQLTLLGEETAVATTVATATPAKTATTVRKSTLKVPTTWPSNTPTEESPVDPALVIGAVGIGIGLVVFRRW